MRAQGFKDATQNFDREAGVDNVAASADEGSLEKKWTSILRLQKKVKLIVLVDAQ